MCQRGQAAHPGIDPAQAEMLTRFSEQPTLSKEIWQIADRYLHAGQYEQAQELCSYGMRAYPDGPWMGDYNIIQVKIHLAKGDVDQANASLESLWTMHAEQEGIVEMLATIKTEYWLKGHHEASQRLCKRIIAAYPDDPATVSVLSDYICGEIAIGRDADVWQDVEAFWQQYQSHPEFVEMVHRIAHHYLHQSGDVGRSLELNLRLLNEYPRHEAALKIERDMAIAYLDMGAKEMADARLESLLTTYADHPSLPEALNQTGDAYRRHGHYAEAINLFETALAQNPNDTEKLRAYTGGAQCVVRLGDDEAVDMYVDTIISELGHLPEAARGIFLIGEEYYFKARELFGAEDVNIERDFYLRAIVVLEEAFQAADNIHYYGLSHYVRGLAYMQTGDYAKAAEAFESSYRVYPEYHRADYCMFAAADCYDRLAQDGEISQAEAESEIRARFTLLLERHPDSRYAANARGFLGLN